MVDPQLVISVIGIVAVPAILGGVWLIRLEGRVNTQDALHSQLRSDLTYIRERIDKAINGHGV
jgi:sensor domain CHASE-containing protein